ncbi:MAG: hypothetical protein HXS52_10140 [Theionarchaea archaeon]|nr:hypothetical protein [Theionarchaea archaeon]MBU7038284.1 hypothetical protein [Theionarchaea archaeon]
MTLGQRLRDRIGAIVPQRLTAQEIAFSGIMAAVMAVAAFIPVTVVAGVGKVISAAVALEPLVGVLLGPVLGTYAAAAGGFVGQILAPQGAIFGLLTFIPPTVGAATAGLLAHKKWKTACVVMVGVLLLWYSTSIGRELYYYPYMPLLFLGLGLLFREHLGEWIHVQYGELVGFRGAGIWFLLAGVSLVGGAWIVVTLSGLWILGTGIVCGTAGVAGILIAVMRDLPRVRKISGGLTVVSGILAIAGAYGTYGESLLLVSTVLFCSTCALGVLALDSDTFKVWFLVSLCGLLVSVIATLGIEVSSSMGESGWYSGFRLLAYAAVILGVLLFAVVHLKPVESLRKWCGFTFLAAGILGLMQQVLLLSLQSQVMRTELLRLDERIPFSTESLGHEITLISTFTYYGEKVLPLYMNHLGWLLIFAALVILGISFFLNISLEKLSVAYFVISGFAVLSDLMIGNFLAVQVLELNTGIFRAFLFIYPVERMFMAFFATVFGIGVIIPLKRFGLTNFVRR